MAAPHILIIDDSLAETRIFKALHEKTDFK